MHIVGRNAKYSNNVPLSTRSLEAVLNLRDTKLGA